jgi:NitT/TauT family transport system permease protein
VYSVSRLLTGSASSRDSSSRAVGAVVVGRLVGVLALLAAWTVAALLAEPLYVPAPMLVLERLVAAMQSGAATRATLATVWLTSVGLFLGVTAGLFALFASSAVPRVMVAVERLVIASGAAPKYALMPLLIFWLGIGDAPKLSLVALLVFYPVFVFGLAGYRSVNRQLMTMVLVLGANRWDSMRYVRWHSTLPFAFAALRVAVPRAVSGAIVSELLVGDDGIGFMIESARQSFDTAGLFVAVTLAALLATMGTFGVGQMERWLMPWRPNTLRLWS